MNAMFYNCIAVLNVQGIHNWDTKNVTNMNCLPDISIWDVSNTEDMTKMFIIVVLYNHYLIFLNGIFLIKKI